MTSAGISAGINASLYCVSKLASVDIANETAKRMEYEYRIENS
ncbi:AraC family transcriptional regulator [Psychrobacter phenylpyruvicus]|nr:AraC family transcriptional regulator [Psychrobacter phenylpyruvicus]